MKARGRVVSTIAVLMLASVPAMAEVHTERSYSNVDKIDLDGTSGDVTIREGRSAKVRIDVRHEVRPAKAFHASIEQRGGTVYLREDWSGRSSSGNVEWVIELPASSAPTIEVGSSSGDLDAEGVEAKFRFRSSSGNIRLDQVHVSSGSSFRTSSGDIELTRTVFGENVSLQTSSGDVIIDRVQAGSGFEFSTSSGDVRISKSRGVLDGSSSSGDVDVRDTELSGPSSFSSSSGNVSVHLVKSPRYELEASSSSGGVRLNVGFGRDFSLIMSKREDRGRIESPFPVTAERHYMQHGQRYVSQEVQRGAGGPEIRLHTASGSITVKDVDREAGSE